MRTAQLPDIGQLYLSKVMHRRMFPVSYRFTYNIFGLLVNLDQLENLSKLSKLLSFNRFNLFSFHSRDHGKRDGSDLKIWAQRHLDAHGLESEGVSIYLHSMPRVLGYTLNPISYWFCYSQKKQLLAILVEVHNTFGDQHTYLLKAEKNEQRDILRASKAKNMHVSPFINMQATYHFRLTQPGKKLTVMIREEQEGELMLVAGQHGHSKPITTGTLLMIFFSIPLMTFKVVAMIHWQAIKIYFKGGKFHKRPAPPTEETS